MTVPFFPPEAASGAAKVDHLYFFLTGASAVILVIVFAPMIYCLFKYRRGRRAERRVPRVSTLKIEIAWTIAPFVLAMGMFAWGARVYFDLEVPPGDTIDVNVVGKQWMWKVEHLEGNREINELHVPVDRDIKVTLASEDVIHSFYVPAFRIKQDVVPGRFTTVWFHPTEVGRFHLFCAEFCGTDHSLMGGTVDVMTPADYEAWLARGGVSETLAQTGARVFRTLGCSGCHEGSGSVRAPDLHGLYGSLVSLDGGAVVRADDKYIRDSILLPASQVTAGYDTLMPTFQGRISEEELLQVIAYLKSIGGTQAGDSR